ncbi:MAG: magnesium-dependent phosphatase-1 [Candidatus Parvarchaeota archaeon]
MDLDGTLWDHLDISVTTPPFKRVSETQIEDSKGVKITLISGAVEFIKWVKENGGIISTCSWNVYSIAMSALETFGLATLFDYHMIYTNPNKYESIEKVIKYVNEDGKEVRNDLLFYLDDRDIHIEEVRKRFPELTFFHMWKNGTDFEFVKREILSRIKKIVQ